MSSAPKLTYESNGERCWYSAEKPVLSKPPRARARVTRTTSTALAHAALDENYSSDAQGTFERRYREIMELLEPVLSDCRSGCPSEAGDYTEWRHDEEKYRAARGQRSMLRAYIALCSICAFKDAAQAEIATIPAWCDDGFRFEANRCIRIAGGHPTLAFGSLEVPKGATFWKYNDALVYLEASGLARKFYLHRPSERMIAKGAGPGMLFFEGNYKDNQYSGTAYFFSGTCGALPYYASGPVLDGYRRVLLAGQAPVVNPDCEVTAHRETILEFTLSASR
jgi:hypothetical protein